MALSTTHRSVPLRGSRGEGSLGNPRWNIGGYAARPLGGGGGGGKLRGTRDSRPRPVIAAKDTNISRFLTFLLLLPPPFPMENAFNAGARTTNSLSSRLETCKLRPPSFHANHHRFCFLLSLSLSLFLCSLFFSSFSGPRRQDGTTNGGTILTHAIVSLAASSITEERRNYH